MAVFVKAVAAVDSGGGGKLGEGGDVDLTEDTLDLMVKIILCAAACRACNDRG